MKKRIYRRIRVKDVSAERLLEKWAAQTIPLSFWAGAFYHEQRARGASRQSALRSLAYKWTRILFRCWQDRVPYDESKYLKALQKRRSPLLRAAANSLV